MVSGCRVRCQFSMIVMHWWQMSPRVGTVCQFSMSIG